MARVHDGNVTPSDCFELETVVDMEELCVTFVKVCVHAPCG